MKSFFYIVFGGLSALIASIVLFSVGAYAWQSLAHVRQEAAMTVASALASNIQDPFLALRAKRYSAVDEEDVINAAADSLPHTGVANVTAKAYSVKNLTRGTIITEKNPYQLLPVASLSKLVTAVVARRYIPDLTRITITKTVTSTYGNTADFKAGETFSAGDLLYPLLLVSSNDAAEAYARYYGRSKFISAMNDFAQSIGAYRTSFADPSGLDPKNVSTANDQALILDWIRKNDPMIIATTELKTKTVRSHTWINPTHLLSLSYYVGGKNGYLPEANRTNASLFKIGNQGDIYSVVVLGSSSRDSDVLTLLKKIGGTLTISAPDTVSNKK